MHRVKAEGSQDGGLHFLTAPVHSAHLSPTSPLPNGMMKLLLVLEPKESSPSSQEKYLLGLWHPVSAGWMGAVSLVCFLSSLVPETLRPILPELVC